MDLILLCAIVVVVVVFLDHHCTFCHHRATAVYLFHSLGLNDLFNFPITVVLLFLSGSVCSVAAMKMCTRTRSLRALHTEKPVPTLCGYIIQPNSEEFNVEVFLVSVFFFFCLLACHQFEESDVRVYVQLYMHYNKVYDERRYMKTSALALQRAFSKTMHTHRVLIWLFIIYRGVHTLYAADRVQQEYMYSVEWCEYTLVVRCTNDQIQHKTKSGQKYK